MRRALLYCAAIAFAVACGDSITEPIPDRTHVTQVTTPVAFATTTTEDGLSISTDKDDYQPGDTVHFTGSGWQPGDVLDIVLVDDPLTHESHTWSVNVGEGGTFHDSTYVVDTGDLGVTFTLTATSRATGRSLSVTFTDGNVRVSAAPNGVTFTLTATRFATTNCTGTGTVVTPVGGATVTASTTPSFATTNTQSVLLVASATSLLGDAFSDWATSEASSTIFSESGTSLCVIGFGNNPSAGGTRDYIATYDAKVDLTINKDDAGATFGNTGQYTLTVTNSGTATTNDAIQVSDPLPTGLTFQSFSGSGWNCPAAGGATSVVCTRSAGTGLRLGPGEAAPPIIITVNVVAPPSGGSYSNTATVSGGGEPADKAGNNTDTETTPVVDLTIDKSHNGDFTRGTNEEYTLTVTNPGSGATTANVTVSDALPSGLTFVSGTGDGWNNCTASGQNVSCVRPVANSIAAGGTAPAITLTVEVGATTASSITNTASVNGGGEPTANSGNNSDSDLTAVVNANGPPVAVDDAFSVNEDNTLTVPVGEGVLANDTDPDGNALTAVLVSGPAAGSTSSFTLSPDGSFSFAPVDNFNGSVSFTYKANDGLVNSATAATVTITVNAVNDPPSFTKGADQVVLEDAAPVSVDPWATAISKGPADENGQTVNFVVTSNTNAGLFSAGPAVSPAGVLTFTPAPNANGTATVKLVLKDDGGTASGGNDTSGEQSFTITVTAVNDAPSFTKGPDQTANEGAGLQTVTGWATNISAGPADESGQTVSFEIAGNSNPTIFSVAPAIAANGTLTYTPSLGPNGMSTISVRIKDNGGVADGGVDASGVQTFDITVNNVPPTILTLTLPVAPLQVGTSVNLSATFNDQGTADVHTALINWDDGTSSNGVVSEATQTVSGSHTYNAAGIYTVTLTVTDDHDSDTESFLYVVVYDPNAGFVTGGGWIMSPAGAYAADPTMTGKATFGFVSKYIFQKDKTAPVLSGNTEFQFHAGNLNFSSTSYQWLVVSGTSKATYKGTGTVNGIGSYGFLLSAIDGAPDKFRIKIWQIGGAVIYDNQVIGLTGEDADPSTAVAGGSIVIHVPKKTT